MARQIVATDIRFGFYDTPAVCIAGEMPHEDRADEFSSHDIGRSRKERAW
jgi:hypothetical protein